MDFTSKRSWNCVSTEHPADESARTSPYSSVKRLVLYANGGFKKTPQLVAGYDEMVCPIRCKMHGVISDFSKDGAE